MPPPHMQVELLSRETAFQGYFRVDRYSVRHSLFGGGVSGTVTREVFERGHAVAVLPYDPVRDEVVLIEQFRVGPYAHGEAPWMIEIVAGIIDPGESAVAVAERELREEANQEGIGNFEPMLTCYLSPGGTTETCALFCVRVDTSKAGGVFGLPGEGEDIRVTTANFTSAMGKLAAGEIRSAPAIMALQWLALNRDSLRHRWA